MLDTLKTFAHNLLPWVGSVTVDTVNRKVIVLVLAWYFESSRLESRREDEHVLKFALLHVIGEADNEDRGDLLVGVCHDHANCQDNTLANVCLTSALSWKNSTVEDQQQCHSVEVSGRNTPCDLGRMVTL
ncbi:hypothetical protein BC937DRAFT_94450 [Endogone sp. FLAS-F59071]|nr:hypothetical protein BC937DRAFT_94450 [Endogone sp. FLAS-F59071]|eukprot:RUS14034.1 hypothetical protein BC937DRAFT_94450 [Endogone sp. FLAS-F59071]